MGDERERALAVLREALAASGVEHEEPQPGHLVASLPGERRLSTTCSILVGEHSLTVNAFVVRHADENAEAFYRWLLQRNLRARAVAFAIDPHGDVYLVGWLPLHAVTPEEVDVLLGTVLELADSSFNTLLELGFASSIRAEWEWRTRRGESTANLEAFRHLAGPASPGDLGEEPEPGAR